MENKLDLLEQSIISAFKHYNTYENTYYGERKESVSKFDLLDDFYFYLANSGVLNRFCYEYHIDNYISLYDGFLNAEGTDINFYMNVDNPVLHISLISCDKKEFFNNKCLCITLSNENDLIIEKHFPFLCSYHKYGDKYNDYDYSEDYNNILRSEIRYS